MDSKTAVFEEVSQRFSETLQKNILITPMEAAAIKKWNHTWRTVPNPRKKPDGGWDWAELRKQYYFKKFKYREQYRIDIAIWTEQELCGLALGGIDKNNAYLAIDYIEGSPIEHSLKGYILDIVLTIIYRYATIYHISELRLNEPVDGLISLYKSKGFEIIYGDKTFCFLRLHNEHTTF